MIRFKKLNASQTEAGALNVAADLRGLGLGEAVLKELIGEKALVDEIVATAYPFLKITPDYIGPFGFVAMRLGDELGYGQPFFRIVRNDNRNRQFRYFNRPTAEIAAELGAEDTFETTNARIYRLPANLSDQQLLAEITRRFTGSDWSLTAYRPGQTTNEPTYLAYERQPTETKPLRD